MLFAHSEIKPASRNRMFSPFRDRVVVTDDQDSSLIRDARLQTSREAGLVRWPFGSVFDPWHSPPVIVPHTRATAALPTDLLLSASSCDSGGGLGKLAAMTLGPLSAYLMLSWKPRSSAIFRMRQTRGLLLWGTGRRLLSECPGLLVTTNRSPLGVVTSNLPYSSARASARS